MEKEGEKDIHVYVVREREICALFMLLLSSLGAPNGFPDDGPHTITAVPHMGGQSNNNQGQGTYIHMYNNTSFIPLFPLSPLTFSLSLSGAPGSPFSDFSNPSLPFPPTPFSENTTKSDVLKELMSSTPHSLMGNTPASGLPSVYTPASSDPAISAIKSEIFSPPVPSLPNSNLNNEEQPPQSALRAQLLSPTRTLPSSVLPPAPIADMEGIEIKTEILPSKPEVQAPPPISAPSSALPNTRTPQTPQDTSG